MGLLDFLGLGGGSEDSTSYKVVSTVQGGAKAVGVAATVGGGDRPVEIDFGLDDVNVALGGTDRPLHTLAEIKVPDPIKTDSDVDWDFAVTRPIVSDISSRLDVEPLLVDVCVNVGLTRLPKARIRQPYQSHFGVTILGVELAGFDWNGQYETVIDELAERPHVEPGVHERRPASGHGVHAIGPSGQGGLRIHVG